MNIQRMKVTSKLIWWMIPVVQRAMDERTAAAEVGTEDDLCDWDMDRMLYQNFLDRLTASSEDATNKVTVGLAPVELSGKLLRWLCFDVWKVVQELDPESEGYDANDEWVWNDFLDEMLKASEITREQLKDQL